MTTCRFEQQAAIRSFARAVLCCSRISDTVAVETADERLVLRALGAARAVSVEVGIARDLCSYFRVPHTHVGQTACASSKLLFGILRTTQNLQSLELVLDDSQNRVQLNLLTTTGTRKAYALPFQQEVVPRVVYDSGLFSVAAPPNLFAKALSNFQGRLNECTLEFSRNGVRFCSFLEDLSSNSQLRTQITIHSEEFEEYSVNPVGVETVKLTLAVKGFRAALELADSCHIHIVRLEFSFIGQPLLCRLSGDQTSLSGINAVILLATRSPVEEQSNATGSATISAPVIADRGYPPDTPTVFPGQASTESSFGNTLSRSNPLGSPPLPEIADIDDEFVEGTPTE